MNWIILLVQVFIFVMLLKHRKDYMLNLFTLMLPDLYRSKKQRTLILNDIIDFQFKKRNVFYNFFFPLLLFDFSKY
jgi:hypothetical protein